MKFSITLISTFVFMTSCATSRSLASTVISVDPDRTVVIEDAIDGGIIQQANEILGMTKLAVESDSNKVLDIIINSPGGNVMAGLQFISAMEIAQHRGYTIRCSVTVMAASMAYQILSKCDERYAFKGALLLWHPVRISGYITLTPTDSARLAHDLDTIETVLVDQLKENFKVDEEYFNWHYHAETMHVASSLVKDVPGFITLIDDIEDLPSITGMRMNKSHSRSKPATEKSRNYSGLTDFEYVHPEALRIFNTFISIPKKSNK